MVWTPNLRMVAERRISTARSVRFSLAAINLFISPLWISDSPDCAIRRRTPAPVFIATTATGAKLPTGAVMIRSTTGTTTISRILPSE
jgi:hypothetical protein